jgi:hypothetical protein
MRDTESTGHPQHRVANSVRLKKIQACMERYVSSIIVHGMIEKTLANRGLTWVTVHDSAVPKLVEDSMVGLRLFVDAPRLPSLMLELAEILQEDS